MNTTTSVNTESNSSIAKIPAKKGRDFSLDLLKFILMFFVCINLANFPGIYGELIAFFCGFAPIAFFIVSGYLVLRESNHRSERIFRAMMHSGITFIILTAVYMVINIYYYRYYNIDILPNLKSLRLWFNFIVLNIWPFDIGSSLWYVQSIFYAYVILFILNKLKLLKYDWLISGILLIISVFVGEFAGLIKFSFLGYSYISGNFLTKALPYLLLGCFIRRKMDKLSKIGNLECLFIIIFGVCIMVTEITALMHFNILRYAGHLLGMPIVAFGTCMLAFNNSRIPLYASIFNDLIGYSTKFLYYVFQPLCVLAIGVLFPNNNTYYELKSHTGLIVYIICLILVFAFCFFRRLIKVLTRKSHHHSNNPA